MAQVFGHTPITDEMWDELEELLIAADVGVQTTDNLMRRLRARFRNGEFRDGDDLNRGLQEELVGILEGTAAPVPMLDPGLTVVLLIGVNGVGKTTTIAKLGNYWRQSGRRVLLAAGDTFRAAGVEQLEVWAERLGLPCVASK